MLYLLLINLVVVFAGFALMRRSITAPVAIAPPRPRSRALIETPIWPTT